MRDLIRYPITAPEVFACLQNLAAQLAEQERIGDVRPLLLKTAAEVVLAAHSLLLSIDKRLDGDPKDWLKYTTPWGEATELVKAFQSYNPKPPEAKG